MTPLIEAYRAQHMVVLGLSGSEHLLFGSASAAGPDSGIAAHAWSRMPAALAQWLVECGVSVERFTIGVGSTRTLAWLAALGVLGARTVVAPGEAHTLLAPLPVAVLQQTPDTVEIASRAFGDMLAALEASGVRTLGQLQRLGEAALVRRFGLAGRQLLQLARGEDLRPLRARTEEAWLGARLVFDPPLDPQQVAIALAPLVERLTLTLAQRELAVGKLALILESETRRRLQVMRRLRHPLGTSQALLGAAERLLTGLLADTTAQSAPPAFGEPAEPDVVLPQASERYVVVRLRVGGLHPTTAEQRRLWAAEQQQAGAERSARLTAALATLRRLQGGKQAGVLLRAEAHAPDAVLPEERYRLAPRMP